MATVEEYAIKNVIGDEEFLVAFKVGPNQFKVIRRYAGAEEEKVLNAVDDDA